MRGIWRAQGVGLRAWDGRLNQAHLGRNRGFGCDFRNYRALDWLWDAPIAGQENQLQCASSPAGAVRRMLANPRRLLFPPILEGSEQVGLHRVLRSNGARQTGACPLGS